MYKTNNDMAIVYCTTNLINGKKYIGSHKNNKDSYLGSGVYITKAIKKYGKENFARETLWEGSDDERYKVEQDMCEKLDVANNKMYYNASNKGTGLPAGFEWSKEVLDKYKDVRRERYIKLSNPEYLTNWMKSDEGKEHISNLNKKVNSDKEIIEKRNNSLRERYKNQQHHMKGVPKTDDWKQSRKVKCIHCGIECDKSNHTKWHGDKCKNRVIS
jgi:hypothetical protein